MRVVVQRVRDACVVVDGAVVGAVGEGLLTLVGVAVGDSEAVARQMAGKVARLRIFRPQPGGAERSVSDISGAVLVVSQFTLLADTRRGNRPSWSNAASGDDAERVVAAFAGELMALGVTVQTGRFGAHMEVRSTCDGPVTIVLESDTHP